MTSVPLLFLTPPTVAGLDHGRNDIRSAPPGCRTTTLT